MSLKKIFRVRFILEAQNYARAAVLFFLVGAPGVLRASLPTDAAPAFGVAIHDVAMPDDELAAIRNTGFTWIRTDVLWKNTEKNLGVYDFAQYDNFFIKLKNNGLRAILILDYGNSLYSDAADSQTTNSRSNTDEFRKAYAKWAATVVNRYKGNGFVWEIWNEPNGRKFWPPAADVNEYLALAKAAGAAIRAQAPDEIIIGPATTGIDLAYIEKCLQAGMLEYWSAISFHPYRQTPPETVSAEYAKLRALIAKYAPAGKSIIPICSEWGYSTSWPGLDETKQADYLVRLFTANAQQGVPLSIWYDWRDDGTDESLPEYRFGLVRNQRAGNGSLVFKPSWAAAREFLSRKLEAPKNAKIRSSSKHD